jgi:hypothetical protein
VHQITELEGREAFEETSSFGESDSAKGSVAGSTWTWLWDGKAAGKPAKFRYTEERVSPTSYT